MSSIGPEPRIAGSKFSKFLIPSETYNVDDFFKNLPASKWSLGTYFNEIIEGPDSDFAFDQLLTNFLESIESINKMNSIPISIRSFCVNYIKCKAIIQSCREFFDAKMNLEKKKAINSVVKESVNVTAQTKSFQASLQPFVLSGAEVLKSMPPEILEDTCYVTSDNDDTNDDDHISYNKSIYMKDPEYFDNLVNNVDLSYIGREEEPISASTSTIPIVTSWDSFIIDDIDILKVFGCLHNSLPKKSPEVHPQYWDILDLMGQHKPTKKRFMNKWDDLVNNFKSDIAWNMVELEQFETNFFDNIEHLKLPINEGELMTHFVAPTFRMSIDQNQKKCEQQLVASQERHRVDQDPNDDRARIGQKTNLIITLPTGLVLEAIIQSCREFFDSKMNLEKKKAINSVVKESVNVTAQTKSFQASLQPFVLSGAEVLKSMPPEILEDTCYVTSDNDDTNDDDHISYNKSIYMKDPEYFDNLVNNVDLSYIGREEEPISASTSTIPIVTSWDSFIIDDIDILKVFGCLHNSLPKKSPEVHPQYWDILDLMGQHKPTKKRFMNKWDDLVNNFKSDIAWNMVELEQFETNFFDNIEHLKLPINEGELMTHFVAPTFRMSIDQNQKKCEQQLVASQERHRVDQDPNDDRARIGQKTNLIITLPTGLVLEGFICEVSGGLPAGCPKKIWTDKLKIMVEMRNMINRIIKTFPGLLSEDYI
ncbi:hypothetical protein Glove_75g47 [Diversispora epigaea]|uniref:Uncharacterized protein n=1 Tax=Diversispora epigaea TaxID=1348612 RepID=A0A397JHX9_9GLOM|nr:hypothetical protein Glove_75g47 [Diversispora epigaea]